jgi:membrane-associated phospholipid phosphatase
VDHSSQAPRLPLRAVRVSWRVFAFAGLLLAYLIVILGVVHRSPLITLDRDIWHLNLRAHYPQWKATLNTYVMLGQRAPATMVALPWFVWISWRFRTARPLLLLGTALVVLNLSVGVVKLATGRVGPRQTHNVHDVFAGGDIFPSGHTANTVVLYGVIAMVAVMFGVRLHRLVVISAVFLALTVGLCTVYLDTHWLTDVIGGWMAGGLVLLVLPTLMPFVERLYNRLARRYGPQLRRGRHRLALRPAGPPLAERLGSDGVDEPSDDKRVPAQL